MVFGLHGADHVDRLDVEDVGQGPMLGHAEIALHVTDCDGRKACKSAGQCFAFARQVCRRHGAIDDAECRCFGS